MYLGQRRVSGSPQKLVPGLVEGGQDRMVGRHGGRQKELGNFLALVLPRTKN
jgi:hypothetical protein